MMEVINDWQVGEPDAQKARDRVLPGSAQDIGARLQVFKPPILNLYCYEDVGYPWVQVVFNHTIGPDVALRVGDVLAEAAGVDRVYFNSLRPRAVYFVLDRALSLPQDLPASRYGEKLATIRASWAPAAQEKSTRHR